MTKNNIRVSGGMLYSLIWMLFLVSQVQLCRLPVSSSWKPPCAVTTLNIQLELPVLYLTPNAWIGPGIETLWYTPVLSFLGERPTASSRVSTSLRLPACPVLAATAGVSSIFSQGPLLSTWICQTNMLCSTNYWPHSQSACSLGTHGMSWPRHLKHIPPHLLPDQFDSCQKTVHGFFAPTWTGPCYM